MAQDFGQQATGANPPRSFILGAEMLDFEEEHKIIREDIKRNRIRFVFPSGINDLDLLVECRALTRLDDFDEMFDVVMQMLVDKTVEIHIQNEAGRFVLVTQFHVTNKYQDLRGDNFIDEFPVVVTWLVEFMAGKLLKKYPEPGKILSVPQPARETKAEPKKTRKKAPTRHTS